MQLQSLEQHQFDLQKREGGNVLQEELVSEVREGFYRLAKFKEQGDRRTNFQGFGGYL
jgi:hypothetical protein